MNSDKVLVAMSGGVDSSVAARILLGKGYYCEGVTLVLYDDADALSSAGISSGDSSVTSAGNAAAARAAASAAALAMPLTVLDCQETFNDKVVQMFVDSYMRGWTPNPCVECNRHLKFGTLLDYTKTHGFSHLATGHYARVSYDPASHMTLLKKAADVSKDQSYVLYTLTQKQLSRVLFPLGELSKSEVREIALADALPSASAPDSQDICFIPDGDYKGFIERTASDAALSFAASGQILDKSGKVIGAHGGTHRFTIGQRKGLGVALGEPAYVCGIDAARNAVYVGDEKSLYKKSLIAHDINLIASSRIDGALRVMAKTRYRQAERPATIRQTERDELHVEFDEPQRALTPGQAVVFYDGDIVIGGGTIDIGV